MIVTRFSILTANIINNLDICTFYSVYLQFRPHFSDFLALHEGKSGHSSQNWLMEQVYVRETPLVYTITLRFEFMTLPLSLTLPRLEHEKGYDIICHTLDVINMIM